MTPVMGRSLDLLNQYARLPQQAVTRKTAEVSGQTTASLDQTGVLIARFPQIRRTSRKPAGFEFIDENGGGPGVHLRKPQRSKKSK
jgi:hypothetical protein